MPPDTERPVPGNRLANPPPPESILHRIGWKGLLLVVWHSTPLALRPIAFPYGVVVYKRLLATSNNLPCLHTLHAQKYRSSLIFRLLRPRYHQTHRLLGQKLGLEGGSHQNTKAEARSDT